MKALPALLVVPFLGGCVAAAAAGLLGVGAVMYLENEAYRDFEASLDETWNATVLALDALGYASPDAFSRGSWKCEIVTGDTEVRLYRQREEVTRVRVRVGAFDHEDHRRRAGLLLDEIARRLE